MSVSCHRFPLWRQKLRSLWRAGLWRVGDYDFVFCVNGPILTSGMNLHAPIKYLIFCKVIRWRQHNYKKLVTNVHYLFTWRLAPTFNRCHQHRNSVTKIQKSWRTPVTNITMSSLKVGKGCSKQLRGPTPTRFPHKFHTCIWSSCFSLEKVDSFGTLLGTHRLCGIV